MQIHPAETLPLIKINGISTSSRSFLSSGKWRCMENANKKLLKGRNLPKNKYLKCSVPPYSVKLNAITIQDKSPKFQFPWRWRIPRREFQTPPTIWGNNQITVPVNFGFGTGSVIYNGDLESDYFRFATERLCSSRESRAQRIDCIGCGGVTQYSSDINKCRR